MDVYEIDVITCLQKTRFYTELEIQEIQNSQNPLQSKEDRIKNILSSIGCVNETHLQKDIFISEAFGQLQGVTPQHLYQANPGYTSLIDAKNAI